MNKDLTRVELEIYLAIKYGDAFKVRDLGAGEQVDVNFKIEIERGIFTYPILLAASLGEPEVVRELVKNPKLKLDVIDEETGTNSFWLAAFYGRGENMIILADAGINILNVHKVTNSNALHVAVERKHYEVA